ncbi:MAG: TPM domain-containing protein [Hyphomicrobium sp.]|nr:TPM domain-containing protein [Hyphomicrobium sp.]
MRALLAVLALVFAMLVSDFRVAEAADPVFPALTGRIVDEANLLTPADEAELTAALQSLEEKSSDQLVVVTLKSLQGFPIEDFGVRLGRQWGIGQAGKDNGVLLIVAPNERKVRIEVGRRLEPLLTDAMSRIIIENAILPGFRRGDFADGIRAGVRDINDVLLGDAEAVKQRARGMHQAPETDWLAIVIIVLWIAIVAYSIYQQNQQARQLPPSARRRRSRRFGNDGIIILPGGSGNWSGGSGGGWSGGGGSFGGGGASGSW